MTRRQFYRALDKTPRDWYLVNGMIRSRNAEIHEDCPLYSPQRCPANICGYDDWNERWPIVVAADNTTRDASFSPSVRAALLRHTGLA